MLVLSRKKDESIVVELLNGESIHILVTRIGNDRVQLGITAPKEYRINRSEFYESSAMPLQQESDSGAPDS